MANRDPDADDQPAPPGYDKIAGLLTVKDRKLYWDKQPIKVQRGLTVAIVLSFVFTAITGLPSFMNNLFDLNKKLCETFQAGFRCAAQANPSPSPGAPVAAMPRSAPVP